MNVAALVSRKSLSRLESALSVGHSLSVVDSLECIRCRLDEGRAEIGLIDLDACGDEDLRLLTAIVSRHGPAIVAYATFAQASVRTIVRLAGHGLCHVLYRGVDDGPARMRQALVEAAGSRMSGQIVAQISTALSSCSGQFREGIASLFNDPLQFRSATDVARAAGITRRSLDRTLRALELAPGRTFVLAAHLTWAYPRMRTFRARVSDVARELGVAKPERFAQHSRLLLGLPPSVVRTSLSPDQFVEMIVLRLRRQPHAASAVGTYEPPRHGRASSAGRVVERATASDGVAVSV
jgi:AraC-like DNA-binding protein